MLWSYFHFYRTHLRYEGSFERFFDLFINGRVGYGSWFKHVSDWLTHAEEPNCLVLHYEDLIRNFEASVHRIAGFCGRMISEERYASITECCSFDFMKRHQDKFDFGNEILCELGIMQGRFIRHGEVAAWKSVFTSEQSEQFDRALQSGRLNRSRFSTVYSGHPMEHTRWES